MIFRLHSRLVLWNLLIIGIIVSILGYFLNNSLRRQIETQIKQRLTQESALAGAYLAQADPNADLDELAGRIADLLHVQVTIISHDGRGLGDSNLTAAQLRSMENQQSRPEVRDAETGGSGTDTRWNPASRAEFVYVARRLDPYVVRFAVPLTEIDSSITDLRQQLLYAMFIAAALTVAFGYLVRGLISRPLREIAAASTKLAAGDLNQRLPISGEEEIAALGNSLNTMAKNIGAQMQALSEGKQRLELIVGAMTEGVMVLDSTGRISLTNRAVRQLLDSDRDLSGRTPLDVFRNPEIERAVRKILDGGNFEVVEMTVGNARIIQANVAPVANAAGIVDSVVIVFHDLTEIRRVERMRRDFVANVSHEFKTPLTSIRGYAETLLSGALQDRKNAADFVGTIQRNAQHLETLVTDLLTLARLEAELPASLEPMNIKTMVDDQIASRKAAISERSVQVVNECPPIEILADRLRLSAAVSNLIDNAIYYNKPNGEIRINGGIENGTFHMEISDTGRGIAGEDLPRIFERFYRVDKARSRDSSGRTGLGLSIVKHAIESQGGAIAVSSRIGVGSTFSIKLPVVKPDRKTD